jgi:thioredoxin 2
MVRSLPDVRAGSCSHKVDTERYPEFAAKYNVHGIPNFIVFYGGRLVTQQAGLVDHNQMENWLRSAGPVSAA